MPWYDVSRCLLVSLTAPFFQSAPPAPAASDIVHLGTPARLPFSHPHPTRAHWRRGLSRSCGPFFPYSFRRHAALPRFRSARLFPLAPVPTFPRPPGIARPSRPFMAHNRMTHSCMIANSCHAPPLLLTLPFPSCRADQPIEPRFEQWGPCERLPHILRPQMRGLRLSPSCHLMLFIPAALRPTHHPTLTPPGYYSSFLP